LIDDFKQTKMAAPRADRERSERMGGDPSDHYAKVSVCFFFFLFAAFSGLSRSRIEMKFCTSIRVPGLIMRNFSESKSAEPPTIPNPKTAEIVP
jgi:hypothetical protein